MSQERTIILKGYPSTQEEAKADAADILPGFLLYLMDTGNVAKQATAGRDCEKLFAIENDLAGQGIDDLYPINTRVQYVVATPGMWINACLADGENVAIGDSLEAGGGGKIRKLIPQDADSSPGVLYMNSMIGYAMEAVDLSGSALEDPSNRIAVRIA